MPSTSSIAFFTTLAGLAFASPISNAEKRRPGTYRIHQVQSGTVVKSIAVELEKAHQKYSKIVPSAVASAAAAVKSGSVTATSLDLENSYISPVTIDGTTFLLDFDTGSSDL